MMYEEWLKKQKRAPRHKRMVDEKEVVQAMHEGGVTVDTMSLIYGVSKKYVRWILTQ